MEGEQDNMTITFLGTGTSQGVPVIACDCDVCLSVDSKDNRLRTSVLLTIAGINYLIDSGPDFRQQMLREKVGSLEAVVFTHEHKDHIAGLDDVRAFNFKQKKAMNLYGDHLVEKAIKREFHYAFGDNNYPGIPVLKFNKIENTIFDVNGVEFLPIKVLHYKLPVFGYRVGDFTYITDAKTIAEKELEKVKGTKILVINALRRKEHISHFNLEEALEIISIIKPEKAYLNHISHLFDKHENIQVELPENVFVAYDGLKLSLNYGK